MITLGIIPARGGSKRIPRKNVRLLEGRPLIAWTIGAAQHAQSIDYLCVSTEDREISEASIEQQCAVVKRPRELATDEASSYDVILHAIDEIGKVCDYHRWPRPDTVCLLQPTSPFRYGEDIDNAADMFEELVKNQAAVPALVTVSSDNTDQPNGAIYMANINWLMDRLASGVTHPFDDPSVPFMVMSPEASIDIDTEEDWDNAEKVLRG